MLTIENILKIQNQDLVDGWKIQLVYEATHNDTYIFELVRDLGMGGFTTRCKIALERNGIKFEENDIAYFFIYNSKRTDVCVTADWLADKDNMVDQLNYILTNKEKL